MENIKEFAVFSKRVALALRNFGFNWKRIEPSRNNPGLNVWIFVDTAQLRAAINMINGK